MTKVKLRLIKECVALSNNAQFAFPGLCTNYKASNCCDAIGELSIKLEPPTQTLTIEMQNGMILDNNEQCYDWKYKLDIDKYTKSNKWYVKGRDDTPDTLNMRLMETDVNNVMRTMDFEFDIHPVSEFQNVPVKKIIDDTQSYFEELQMLECTLPVMNPGTFGMDNGKGNDDDDINTTHEFIHEKEFDDMSPRSFKKFIIAIKPPELKRNANFVASPEPFPSRKKVISEIFNPQTPPPKAEQKEEVPPYNMMF